MPRQLLRLKHVALAFLVYVFVSSLPPVHERHLAACSDQAAHALLWSKCAASFAQDLMLLTCLQAHIGCC